LRLYFGSGQNLGGSQGRNQVSEKRVAGNPAAWRFGLVERGIAGEVPMTPLHDWEAKQGAEFDASHGSVLPRQYVDVGAEHEAACRSSALFDCSHHGKIDVKGRDAASFLHNLCTNEIVKLAPGTAVEAFFTTGQARIVGFAIVYHVAPTAEGDLYSLDAGPGQNLKIMQHLDRYMISEQVELQDRTSELAQLHLAGPSASAILDNIAGPKASALEPLHCSEARIGATDIVARRHDWLGLPGFDVLCQVGEAASVAEAFRRAGALPAGTLAQETLRIEAGTPEYGIDIDETNLPQEVGRAEATISFTKGCYIGQETIARIRTYGHVNRCLVGLKFASEVVAPPHSRILYQGKEVGSVTSSIFSLKFGATLAMAYLRRGSQEPGFVVEVEVASARHAAEVTSLPFVSGPA
jgi:folate-binding protein YgfZ